MVEAKDDEMNIDGSAFAVDEYVGTLLQNKSLEELVQRGNAMVQEIKSLDSDMQMLVYENYNKFISATDTIRKMRHRVEGMETQMVELEQSMNKIASASETVDASLSQRRGQLEKLNGAKKNLTKLQFLTELPTRLQQCVREDKLDVAIAEYRRAQKVFAAVGQVGSFEGIQNEARLIMKRLAQALSVKLQQPTLGPGALSQATRLLLQLEGHEASLLKEYLSRRRRALHEVLSSFSPAAVAATSSVQAGQDEGDRGEGTTEGDATEGDDDSDGLMQAASSISQLGAAFVPQLVELHSEWQAVFMPDAREPVLGATAGAGGGEGERVTEKAKEAMLLDALQDLCGGYIEMCRRRLQQVCSQPEALYLGVKELVRSLDELHAVAPHAKLMHRATRAAEQLAKRSVEERLQALQATLVEQVAALTGSETGGGATAAMLHAEAQEAGSAVADQVSGVLTDTAPLLVPLCQLLGLRTEVMAKYMVVRLYGSLLAIATSALKPTARASGVLVRAGLCLHMASHGVTKVSAMLQAQLSPHGLGGVAMGFDKDSLSREMQEACDDLVKRFVEMQAQKLSLQVTERMEGTDWLQCRPPTEVTHLVDVFLAELEHTQGLAGQVLRGEVPKSSQSQASLSALRLDRISGATNSAGGIQKDVQRMFARKISFSTPALRGGNLVGSAAVAWMPTHVVKLTLKTLVEEVRLATFSRAGFQQLQVDCAMLRWVLPPLVDDEGAVLALLDEVLISCEERSLHAEAIEQSVVEGLCDAKRHKLLARLPTS